MIVLTFILIILGAWGLNDALKHYKAEKYAQKVVHNRDISFLGFMLSNHPLSLLFLVLLIILFGIDIYCKIT